AGGDARADLDLVTGDAVEVEADAHAAVRRLLDAAAELLDLARPDGAVGRGGRHAQRNRVGGRVADRAEQYEHDERSHCDTASSTNDWCTASPCATLTFALLDRPAASRTSTTCSPTAARMPMVGVEKPVS